METVIWVWYLGGAGTGAGYLATFSDSLYRLKQKALQPTGEECNQIVGKICDYTKMAFETIQTAQFMIQRWPFFGNLLPPIIALLAADAAEALCDYGPMHRIDEMIGSVNNAILLVDEIPLYAIVKPKSLQSAAPRRNQSVHVNESLDGMRDQTTDGFNWIHSRASSKSPLILLVVVAQYERKYSRLNIVVLQFPHS
ncbi:hypothetical protein B0I35DRAFT_414447 [Stachybotrys elegans]|uniref:Uncharacterized protein n=1 Tax=Stachybotrys elegans TaxID=80388 RepID=A0A8K0WLC9_9HYPO|nr:hypothetical protein B0I35DRAFT_414447 [Stachybotrys elegans]